MNEVVWKTIPGFPDYEVSEHGQVRHGTRYLTAERVHGSGRKRFSLSKNGRNYRVQAARLVALAFIGGPPFKGAQVCHNDGFEHNNHFSNLRWDSVKSNMADMLKHKIQRKDHSGLYVSRSDRLVAAANDILTARRPAASARPR